MKSHIRDYYITTSETTEPVIKVCHLTASSALSKIRHGVGTVIAQISMCHRFVAVQQGRQLSDVGLLGGGGCDAVKLRIVVSSGTALCPISVTRSETSNRSRRASPRLPGWEVELLLQK